jgi:hypothetical protein
VFSADVAVKASAVPANTTALAKAMAGSRFWNFSNIIFIIISISLDASSMTGICLEHYRIVRMESASVFDVKGAVSKHRIADAMAETILGNWAYPGSASA